jgi:hypothetical protein
LEPRFADRASGRCCRRSFHDEDMAALDALDETGGTDRALERTWW